tara:strand:+ start:58 stop:438 length:381 start_codon:yes stop_codon:yes gene_type:complete
MSQTIIYCDGGSLNNQDSEKRQGYASFKVNEKIVRIDNLGQVTNNYAEYISLIESAKYCLDNNIENTDIIFNMDSALVVNQVNGAWKIRSESIRKLHKEALSYLKKLSQWELKWVNNIIMKQILGH